MIAVRVRSGQGTQRGPSSHPHGTCPHQDKKDADQRLITKYAIKLDVGMDTVTIGRDSKPQSFEAHSPPKP